MAATSVSRKRLTVGLLLGAVLTIGLVLRTGQMRESLWLDELHTAWAISGHLADVAPRAQLGNNSPLYFYLPWLTTRGWGQSEPAIRMFSLVAGLALVAVVYCVALAWTGHRSMAWMAAALAALDRNFLFYSLEARPYALVQILGVLHVVTFWRLLRQPTLALRLAWIVGAVLLFYVHYTAVLVIPAEVCYFLIARYGLGHGLRYRCLHLLLDLSLVFVLCAPAWGHLMRVASRRENWELFVAQRPLWMVLSVFPLATYLLLPLVVVVFVSWFPRMQPRVRNFATIDHRLLFLVGCWLFVPLGIAWLTTQTDLARLLFRRYVMVVSVAPLLLSALLGSLCPSRAGRLAAASLVVAVGLFTIGPVPQLVRDGRAVNHGDEDWRRAVHVLNTNVAYAALPVFVRSGLIEADALRGSAEGHSAELTEFCLFPVRGIYRLSDTGRAVIPLPTTDAGILTPRQWELIAVHRGAWFLMRGDESSIDRILDQLRGSAEARRLVVTVATRQAFLRRSDPFGLRGLSRVSRTGSDSSRLLRQVALVRLTARSEAGL